MPYIKRNKPFDKIARLIKGCGSNTELAEKLRCSAPTVRAKLNNPGKLTLDDLQHISQGFHVPIEEVRQAISW